MSEHPGLEFAPQTQISQFADFAVCRFRSLHISFRFVSQFTVSLSDARGKESWHCFFIAIVGQCRMAFV